MIACKSLVTSCAVGRGGTPTLPGSPPPPPQPTIDAAARNPKPNRRLNLITFPLRSVFGNCAAVAIQAWLWKPPREKSHMYSGSTGERQPRSRSFFTSQKLSKLDAVPIYHYFPAKASLPRVKRLEQT